MAKWDKMDKLAWENSEVAHEFEKRMMEVANKFKSIAQSTTSDISEKGKQITESLSNATKSVQTLSDAAENLSDDEIKEEEQNAAKQSLLEELKEAAISAADLGNIKLAYRIERTISEITGE